MEIPSPSSTNLSDFCSHVFFSPTQKPGSQGIAIAIKIPSIPEVLRTLLATILPWLLLNSQCLLGQVLVVSKELRVKQFHFVANRHSHHMWPACQDANLAKSMQKIAKMLQITGKFSTSDSRPSLYTTSTLSQRASQCHQLSHCKRSACRRAL